MTVYQSIVNWLNQILFEINTEIPNPFEIIDEENIPSPSDYPGLTFLASDIFSNPNDLTTTLIGGQVKHTEVKPFYLRRPFNEFYPRSQNESFFEKLEYKIFEKNFNGDMPSDGKDWKSIELNAGIYPAQRNEESQWADYLILLKLIYVE